MSDTPNGETVNVEPPKNDVTPPVTTPVVKTEDPAVEELRKQLQQQEMRANQLANQLKSKEEAEAKAKEAEMEQNQEYKTLLEQERAKREALEAAQSEAERKVELDKAKNTVLADYSDDVKTLAEEVGLDLISADDTAVAQFKEKLDKINTRVANTQTVGPNNRQANTQPTQLSGEELRRALEDDPTDKKFEEIIAQRPGISVMLKPKQ